MAFGNENYDFMIPRNGSLFVELVDNMDQYQHALANPLPGSMGNYAYPHMYGAQQPYGMQQSYGMQQAYMIPPVGYDAEQPYSNPQVSYGMMRFGPSYTILGPHPPQIEPGTGVYDPNLVVSGVPNLRIGVY